MRRELSRHGGREIKTVGDGFLAQIELPAAAIRCARAIRSALGELGLEMRAGIHSGECELVGDDIGGLAVHIARGLCTLAEVGEIQVSGTVRDIMVGSSIELSERGEHELKASRIAGRSTPPEAPAPTRAIKHSRYRRRHVGHSGTGGEAPTDRGAARHRRDPEAGSRPRRPKGETTTS